MTRHNLILTALLASIALNLFFIGGIGYRIVNRPDIVPERIRSARPFPPGIGWVLRDLPEERRAEFEDFLEEGAAQLNPARREMFEAQRQVNALLVGEEFDSGQVSAAFARLREASNRYQELSHEETVQLLDQLSEAERQTAVEFIQRGGPRGRGDRRRPNSPSALPDRLNRPPGAPPVVSPDAPPGAPPQGQ